MIHLYVIPVRTMASRQTNNVLKRENTARERLPVGQFLNTLVDVVREWSKAKNSEEVNCIPFYETPFIELRHWTDAYLRAMANAKVIKGKAMNSTLVRGVKHQLPQH